MAGSDSDGTCVRHNNDFDVDVRPHGNAGPLGATAIFVPADSDGDWRLHRVRPAWLCASEHAFISARIGALGTDAGRTSQDSCVVENPVGGFNSQHSGFMGEVEQETFATLSSRRGQRLWRNADGRKYIARSRSDRGPIHQPRRFPGIDYGDWTYPGGAQHEIFADENQTAGRGIFS